MDEEQNILDSRNIPDFQPNFAGGVVTRLRPRDLQANQCPEMLNMDGDVQGDATTRRGVDNVGGQIAQSRVQGAGFYKTTSMERILAVCNRNLYKGNESSWTQIAGWAATDANVGVSIVQLANVAYFCDGYLNLHKTDGTTVTDLLTGTNTQPKIFEGIFPHGDRIIGWQRDGDEIFASDFLTGDTWNNTDQKRTIGKGRGIPIRGGIAWTDFNLVIGKATEAWIVYATPATTPKDWEIKRLLENHGLVSKDCITLVGKDVWLLTQAGVLSTQRTLVAGESHVDEIAVSWPIQEWIDRINWEFANRACATFWRGKYFLAVPIDDAEEPDHVFVYNTLSKSWRVVWLGWFPTCWVQSNFNKTPRLNFGDKNGYVQRWKDYIPESQETAAAYQDNGADYASHVVGRSMTFREPQRDLTGLDMEVDFYKSKANATISAILDLGDEKILLEDVQTKWPGLDLPFDLPFSLPSAKPRPRHCNLLPHGRFRELQPKVAASAGKLSVRSIKANAFADKIDTADKPDE